MVFGEVAFGKRLRRGPHEWGGGCGLVAKSCPAPATPWTVARQASLFMGGEGGGRGDRDGEDMWTQGLFISMYDKIHYKKKKKKEYWRGMPFPSPGDLPNSGTEPGSPTLQADSLLTELQGQCLYKRNSTKTPSPFHHVRQEGTIKEPRSPH